MSFNQNLYQSIKHKRSKGLHQIIHHWQRQPIEQWSETRRRIWQRDRGLCQSPEAAAPKLGGLCQATVSLDSCHIDHIQPLSSGGSNHHTNLRTLCSVCHSLRVDRKHAGMPARLVKAGLLPVNWKDYVWE